MAELVPRVSPFVRLQVASPPYRRITVEATVVVQDDARMATFLQELQTDLVRFLSPWPDADLGPRPAHYYLKGAISQFIRDRPYIKSIDSLALKLDDGAALGDDQERDDICGHQESYVYYTSALRHDLRAIAASAYLASTQDGVVP